MATTDVKDPFIGTKWGMLTVIEKTNINTNYFVVCLL